MENEMENEMETGGRERLYGSFLQLLSFYLLPSNLRGSAYKIPRTQIKSCSSKNWIPWSHFDNYIGMM